MYFDFPEPATRLSLRAQELQLGAGILSAQMGHDVTDSLHLVAAVFADTGNNYPTALRTLTELGLEREWVLKSTKSEFVSFGKLPERRYVTESYEKALRLSGIFAVYRKCVAPTETDEITTSDLLIAAFESGSPKLDKLLHRPYLRPVKNILELAG